MEGKKETVVDPCPNCGKKVYSPAQEEFACEI